MPGPAGILGINPLPSPLLPPIRIYPNPAFITVFALLSSLMLPSSSHKVGVYMRVRVCVGFGVHRNASHPFNHQHGWNALQCDEGLKVGTHTSTLARTDVFLERRAAAYSSALVAMDVACAVSVCCWSCKQALLMKWRWSTESCSHFKHHLFISPPCGTHTHTKQHTHTR